MRTARHVFARIARSFWLWLCFELLVHVPLLSLIGPGIKLSLDAAMALLGYDYLTGENIGLFLFTPTCIAFALVWFALLTLAILFELSSLYYIFAFEDVRDKPRVQDAVRYALHRTIRTVRRPAKVLVIPCLSLFLLLVRVGAALFVILFLDPPVFGQGYIQVVLWPISCGLCFLMVSLVTSAPVAYTICLESLRPRNKPLPSVRKPESAHVPPWVTPVSIAAVLAASTVCGVHFVIQSYAIPAQTLTQLSNHAILVTAHRGGSFGAPENTMVAFAQAKEDGADVCELDVQQSADGVIFVSHDPTFERVSGVGKSAWELTWNEICELDATGNNWSDKVETQRYPLLDDVVAWAKKNDVMLNIELKSSGHEKDFEKAVADIVSSHDFDTRCIVTSQMYDTVARMKAYAPQITCVYVMNLAYGDICQLEAADAFSVQQASVTPVLVSYLHAHGKPVLAWVVNSNSSMERMAASGVDDLIADDVPAARKVVDETTLRP